MTKRFLFTLMLFAFVLALSACSDDGSKEVIGAWKIAEVRVDRDDPSRELTIQTLLIDKKTLVRDGGDSRDISFAKEDGKILIFWKHDTKRPRFIVEFLDKNTAIFGRTTYVRTTPEEVKRIWALPNY